MAGKFTVISSNAFDELQVDAGVILKRFNPANPTAPADADIVTATTGGITVSCKPTYNNLFGDVDNAPNNTKEGKHLDSWECLMSTTALGTTADTIKLSLGAADTSGATYALTEDEAIVSGKTYYTRTGTDPNYVYTPVASPVVADIATYYELTSPDFMIVPRANLKQDDFQHLWWVGDKADGGMVAVQIKNALSTGGFSLKTTKNGKGNLTLEITGHVSINAQDEVPMVFYSTEGED
jgi:hypothetical protein